jgi:dephospho-CoA kinase
MLKIALTGGAGTGKSAALNFFSTLGIKTVSSDEIVRSLQKPRSPLNLKIAKILGPEVLSGKGSLNRAKVREIIFNFANARRKIERLIHPLVRREREKIIKKLKGKKARLAIFEIPLLFEAGLQKNFDFIICVSSKDDLQISRLAKRNGLSRQDAIKMIKAQFPLSTKEKLSDWVIHNDSGMVKLKKETTKIAQKLLMIADANG